MPMNRRRSHVAAWLLLCVSGVSGLRAEDDAAGTKTIRQWVDDLDNDDFRTREAATRRLRAVGKPAFTPLAAAAAGPSVEVTLRAFAILREGAASQDPAVAKAAKDALLGVIHSRNKTAAARARGI